jgi:hypothetical protein
VVCGWRVQQISNIQLANEKAPSVTGACCEFKSALATAPESLASVAELECAVLSFPKRPIETAMSFEQRIWLPQQASPCAKAISVRRFGPSRIRGASLHTLMCVLGALGCGLAIVPDPDARVQRRWQRPVDAYIRDDPRVSKAAIKKATPIVVSTLVRKGGKSRWGR